MKKKLFKSKWLLVTASLLALYGCTPDMKEKQGASEVSVTTVTVEPKDILVSAELPGRTKASKMAEVRPQVSGIILHRNFVEGSAVEEGETLYQIDPAIYAAALQHAKAGLAQAEANQFAAAEKAKRINALASSNAVSKQDVDDANSLLIQANAKIVAAEAEVNNAEINLRYTKMLAPISGQIGRSNYTQGALVTTEQVAEMAVIQQNDPMQVDITYSAKEFTDMQKKIRDGILINDVPGAIDDNNFSVRIILDDGSTYEHKGFVKFSDRTVDPTTGSILIQAEFANEDQVLLPGMFVRAVVDQGIQKNVITIPQAALFRDAKGNAKVIIAQKDNSAEIRDIEIQQSQGNSWLVSKGLSAGERVVIEGIQQVQSALRSGESVILKVTETKAEEDKPSTEDKSQS